MKYFIFGHNPDLFYSPMYYNQLFDLKGALTIAKELAEKIPYVIILPYKFQNDKMNYYFANPEKGWCIAATTM